MCSNENVGTLKEAPIFFFLNMTCHLWCGDRRTDKFGCKRSFLKPKKKSLKFLVILSETHCHPQFLKFSQCIKLKKKKKKKDENWIEKVLFSYSFSVMRSSLRCRNGQRRSCQAEPHHDHTISSSPANTGSVASKNVF